MTMKNIRIQLIFTLLIILGLAGCVNRPDIPEGDEDLGWQVNDSTLKKAIHEEFKTHPFFTGNNIKLKIDDGIVTLYGNTENLITKDKTTEIVSMIKGVRGIVNLIEVDAPYVNDTVLKANVDEALYKDPVLESYQLILKVDSGVVNLYGRVDSWHEKQLASEVVKTVRGVKEVKNNIAFIYKKNRPDQDIKADIVSLLRNDARIDGVLVDVKVENGTVTLSGDVGSAAEKSLVVANAYVDGVDTVLYQGLDVIPADRDPRMREDKYVKKSDPAIIEAIQQAYLQDPRLLNYDIDVKSDSGNVTLSGAVNFLRAKNAAGKDAANVVGVWKVENNITVEPLPMPVEKPVADVVKTAIEQYPLFDNYKIVAETNNKGKITLTGKVKFYFEKVKAGEIASNVPGVVEVANNIEVSEELDYPYTITPDTKDLPVITTLNPKPDNQIKKDVEYQLWWSPFVDRNQVKIEVNHGKVTLSGTVNTKMEMDYAVRNAYEAGATEVVNNLKVDFWEI